MKNWKVYRNLLFCACMSVVTIAALVYHVQGKQVSPAANLRADVTDQDYTQSEKERQSESEVKPKIALTFDDGPSEYTTKLLDGLRKRGVTATFFVIGKNISGNEEIIRQMAQDGHLIGNHTYDHVNISTLSSEAACLQITKTSSLIRELTGKTTEYVRPPFGEWNQKLDCDVAMFLVMWNIDPLDWTTSNTDLVVKRVVDNAKENGIILLHDIFSSSVDAALEIVDQLQAEGYEFVTVDQLILE